MPRFGLLVPWANIAVEEEMPELLGSDASYHVARLVPQGLSTEVDIGFLDGIVAAVPDGLRQLSHLPLDGVGLACTSAQFASSMSGNLPAGLTTAFDSLCGALRRRSITRVHLVAGYPDDITALEVSALSSLGFNVVSSVALGLLERYETLSSDELVAAALSTHGTAEALLYSCTGLRTIEAMAQLRARNIICMSSNSALAEELMNRYRARSA